MHSDCIIVQISAVHSTKYWCIIFIMSELKTVSIRCVYIKVVLLECVTGLISGMSLCGLSQLFQSNFYQFYCVYMYSNW